VDTTQRLDEKGAIMTPKRILITGAYGLIGNLLYTHLAAQPERYQPYGLARPEQIAAPEPQRQRIPDEYLRIADLTDYQAVQRAVANIDTVVHLAADPRGDAPWESILQNNIIGTQHIFEASRQAGVQRIIFASTNQVVFGYYPRDADHTRPLTDFTPITEQQPTRPINFYSCSKVFGEALAHMYAHTHGMSCINVRIGWVTPDDHLPHPIARMLWCSQRDILQLLQRCVDAPATLRYDTFFAQSDNPHNLVDIQHARDVLGYAPQDNAENAPQRPQP
jgi:NAD+ dependent glucose-6-phosphate dehydrogenase